MALRNLLRADAPVTVAAVSDPNRKFVKAWKLSDLDSALKSVNPRRNRQRGKRLFQNACAACHVYAEQGTPLGPELTGVTARFPRRDLLESILDPSKVVADI